ncbi:uncharacterized protein LOC114916960 [Cajanus cajan]|uniref:uncharacterized protein LOC114916960 n=1 Tax=Cajanus cajan TaxID=3821 RepID=UPI0010FAD4DE|nr:uncharacterized protein LOC114916960 [Cajanus cajan]
MPTDSTENFDNPSLYRSVLGALQYATITRPDIAYSINKLCLFMHKPLEFHWKCVKRLLRYLSGTKDQGLHFQKSPSQPITGFADSDWAVDRTDMRSTTGYCVYLGKNLVSWMAKKQHTVSRSSREAEFRSLAATVSKITWIQSLLTERVAHQTTINLV